MSIARRLRAPLCALLFSLACLAGAPPRAAAQNTGTIVVPAPPFITGPIPAGYTTTHYAEQNKNDPETAHDKWTGQDLKWDRDKKSWVDIKTGQALGFDGQLASDGTVIPAPPFIDTPRIGLHEAEQQKVTKYNGHGNPELAFDDATRQILHWDRYRQSWFVTDWDPNTRSRVNVGPPLGFNGVVVNAGAPAASSATAAAPPPAAVPATETASPCPTPEVCVKLQEIYREADAMSVAAAEALTQATAGREADLAQAAQLDKSASHRGDPDVSKAEHEQAQGLRDKLPNAQANYDAAAKATLDAWRNWQDCLKGFKDCPPKKPAQAGNETSTTTIPPPTGTPTGSAASATPGAPAQPEPQSKSSLASDLCERAKALRSIAAHDRQMADAAQDQRTKDYLLGDAKMMDGMAKEREDLARYYDPDACPEHAQAIAGGNGTSGWTTGTITIPPSTTPAVAGMDPWILLVPGFPLWNKDEQRFYGSNPDGTPRKDEQTEESSSNTSSTSSATPGPAGGTPAVPTFQCTANTPTVQAAGTVDVPLDCTGTPPQNSSIRVRSNAPISMADVQIKFTDSGPTMMIGGTLGNNDHVTSFNLPEGPANVSAFKMDVDLKYKITADYDHLNLGFRGSSGIDITPRYWTAPITNSEIGSFSSFTPQWGGGYPGWGASNTLNNPGSSSLGTPVVGTTTFGWGMNRSPALCTDTTTTTYVPRSDFGLTVAPLDSDFGYIPPRCTLNDNRGSLTLGGSNDFGFGGLRGWSPGSGSGLTPNQSRRDWNGGGIQTPQTPWTTPGFTGNGYGGFYNPSPSPFGFIRPQGYYDDNGPQSRFGVFNPWDMKPSFCDYDFPDKLRAFPALAQALAAEARSRRPRESRASSEPRDAHFQTVSIRLGSPVSNSPSRAARPSQMGGRPRQVAIEARMVEIAPAFTYSIVSNGKSQGHAFELQVADPTGKLKTVAMRDGTIIEAIKPGVTEPVTAPAGGSVVKQPLNAYCLEFHKPPPAEGTLYRIADQATQQKFSSLRFLDRAAAQMSQNNQFHPDTKPEAYKNTIFQYAAWSTLEGWGQEEFTQHLVERTKENAQDLHVAWTQDMENTLRAAAPGRWGDISLMMNQAQALEKASQDRVSSRQSRGQR
jgi:hypothetical protein